MGKPLLRSLQTPTALENNNPMLTFRCVLRGSGTTNLEVAGSMKSYRVIRLPIIAP